MIEGILDTAHKHPWKTVTFLLGLNYGFWLLMVCTIDVLPMDINTISYGSLILGYKAYFGGLMIFQVALFLFQCGILPEGKELPQWIKYFYHFYIAANLCLQCFYLSEQLAGVIAIKAATTNEVVSDFSFNFTMMEHYSSNLQFLSIDEAENDTSYENPGIKKGYSLTYLLNRKANIDEFQKNHKCCGLQSPDDWIEHYTGNLTPEQRKLGPTYVWWQDENGPTQVPQSCCVKGDGPGCGIAKDGCLTATLNDAKMNVTFITVIMFILAGCGITRDIVLVKKIRTVEQDPFPKIPVESDDDRLQAGSDLTKLSNIISVRIGQATESSA